MNYTLNYKKKYLKYKNKYFEELKRIKQVGSGTGCYLKNIFRNSQDTPPEIEKHILEQMDDASLIQIINECGFYNPSPLPKKLKNIYTLREIIEPHEYTNPEIDEPYWRLIDVFTSFKIHDNSDEGYELDLIKTENHGYKIDELTIGYKMDQYFISTPTKFDDNRYNQLINLKKLKLDFCYNGLNNNLNDLVNLKELHLLNYNEELNNSLNNLKNLELLYLPRYNKPLNDSLYQLTKLKKLDISSYNFELNKSLEKLINLEELILSLHDQPLNDSLNNLINLRILNIGLLTNILGNSLDRLKLLEILRLFGFCRLFNNSLKNLINLEELYLGNYDLPLENIKHLGNLKILTLCSQFFISNGGLNLRLLPSNLERIEYI